MEPVLLRRATKDELFDFYILEQRKENTGFVMPYTLARHQSEFYKPEVTYLSILANDSLVGFIILCFERDTRSIEFRRIIVDDKGYGIGQKAIAKMEDFCRNELHGTRIWLDVFEHNERGQHIYQKLGYQKFRSDLYEGKVLHFYEKNLLTETA